MIVEQWIMTPNIILSIAIDEKRTYVVPHWLNPILDPVYFDEKWLLKLSIKHTRYTSDYEGWVGFPNLVKTKLSDDARGNSIKI